MKRLIDITAVICGFMVFAPLFILLPILIYLDDGGPVLFRQWRLGRYKRPFTIYKYRTMRDGRVTRVGRWLRVTGLDELPQFINILKGQMSIVGPRPLTLEDVQRLHWDDRYHISRWHHLPGITGLAQLYAGRGAKVSWFFDKLYNQRHSLWLDMQIIVISAVINIIGKRRVRGWIRQQRHRTENWQFWLQQFQRRAQRPIPLPEFRSTPHQFPASLSRSLAIFQLGESGGGTIVEQVRNSSLRGADQHYARTVALFVKEEHRHADILAQCVHTLGGQLIKNNWTAQLFVFGRRLLGLRLKVLVLLAAEVVGICYYRLLATRMPSCQVRRLLEDVAEEEELHLKFHSAFLRQYTGTMLSRWLLRLAWRAITYSAALVVTLDHYAAIRDMRIPLALVWRRWMYLVRETQLQMLSKQPDYRFLHEVNIQYA